MEEILGRHNDDRAFDRYLDNWREIMASRVDLTIDRISRVNGVHSLILAGSNGLGSPWPLSDIDVIPIYVDSQEDEAVKRVEEVRRELLDEWSSEGWRTGLDIGRLRFSVDELKEAFCDTNPDLLHLLHDDRWYYSIDKGYRGRALTDPDGFASILVAWFTTNRFTPEVVALRLQRTRRDARISLDLAQMHLAHNDEAAAYGALLKSIQWWQVSLLETWGERDNSLGRFGTRFERAAELHGMRHLDDAFNRLSGLDAANMRSRLDAAPGWVHERNDRSWKARLAIGEPVNRHQSDRDVVRVCAMYELRVAEGPPFAEWLAVPDVAEVSLRVNQLRHLFDDLDRVAPCAQR